MTQPFPPAVRRQAAEWLVRLDHQADAETQQAFADWLALDPQHAEAIARLQGHLASLQALPAQPARAALRQAGRPGRSLTSLAIVALIGATTLLGSLYLQQGFALSDLSTASGERHSERLADGSMIDLDASSVVDLQFDPHQRRVNLLQGEILVDVAKDPLRPFYVTTPQGSIRALGTRFIVERLDDATLVTMLESVTRIDSAGHSQTLNAGERLRFDASGPGTVQKVDSLALQNAWNAHQLLAYDQPLSEVLERLARHRKGLVLFDKQAMAALRVTVMLPSDDSDRALRLLARTLPIQVRQYTPWLTLVSVKADSAMK
ncbi:FecR family protein [Pseudomonas sp. BP8]|uniref:FecR family protein n=1 Tax=Pseudomonas sp. BP8 TaxID=2817864 RepID=UPI001AE9AE19|nr:FecR family protein [Pseudomonas sp. BP8]MBP2260460.1 transmembrane sensor [Pseudomonas sp. BP8]HDS1736650.1 FecR family protein [Pseudomonas putida]